ncbi:hypothetical protein GFY24_14335 [Nocardia sp. SYP-A9097]|uniref:hypothetical protein n=1 Tax=Nocardia sp. SYP-A9097 TaxID=2663237 RepID=UPI00129A74EF|nr:hypothetical protein [Nocardia sp. SYP-A9097]MRH88606.1 hypothetical protein [Nocardia sp. SYP-A9097]
MSGSSTSRDNTGKPKAKVAKAQPMKQQQQHAVQSDVKKGTLPPVPEITPATTRVRLTDQYRLYNDTGTDVTVVAVRGGYAEPIRVITIGLGSYSDVYQNCDLGDFLIVRRSNAGWITAYEGQDSGTYVADWCGYPGPGELTNISELK